MRDPLDEMEVGGDGPGAADTLYNMESRLRSYWLGIIRRYGPRRSKDEAQAEATKAASDLRRLVRNIAANAYADGRAEGFNEGFEAAKGVAHDLLKQL